MPQEPRVAWVDDSVVAFRHATVPLEDRGLQFGESLYEVVAITSRVPRLLNEHAKRMRRAAELIGVASGVPTPDEWQRIAQKLQAAEELEEGILIAQVTGGSAPRAHVPPDPTKPRFFAYLRAHRFPREADVARGISAVFRPDTRWALSDLKTNMLLPAVLAKREARARGADEAILVGDDGLVHEGAASNVFVVERRSLVTPRQTHHVLPGLTGPLVGRLAERLELRLEVGEISVRRLLQADEVFVTSTTYLLMPVVEVDGQPIGEGKSGPVAKRLAASLRSEWQLGD